MHPDARSYMQPNWTSEIKLSTSKGSMGQTEITVYRVSDEYGNLVGDLKVTDHTTLRGLTTDIRVEWESKAQKCILNYSEKIRLADFLRNQLNSTLIAEGRLDDILQKAIARVQEAALNEGFESAGSVTYELLPNQTKSNNPERIQFCSSSFNEAPRG